VVGPAGATQARIINALLVKRGQKGPLSAKGFSGRCKTSEHIRAANERPVPEEETGR
jgi:hypothetical protein